MPGNVTVLHNGKPIDTGLVEIRRVAWRQYGHRVQLRAKPRQHHRARVGDVSLHQLARRASPELDCQEPGRTARRQKNFALKMATPLASVKVFNLYMSA